MKTNNLKEQILSKENLNEAYLRVVRNKGAEGIDGMKYIELKQHLEVNGQTIKEQLRSRKYQPQPVRRVEILKPDGGNRNLGVPTVTGRFVQQAIQKTLDMMNDGYDWIVDIDLAKFFDTVNHDKVMTLVGKTIKDGDIISVIRKFLDSGIMIDNEYEEAVIGTPQGGNLSPLLANIILNELDQEMEKRGVNFVRYADDSIIMVGSERSADRVMKSITRFIEEKLGLKVNVTKSKITKPKDLKYLGFGFYYDKTARLYKAKPHKSLVEKLEKKLKELTSRSWGS